MMRVLDDFPALTATAAELFVNAAGQAMAKRGAIHVVLSGGETPRPLYELLATPAWKNCFDWGKTHVYWSDERFVPPADPRSNEGMTRRALLDHVPIPPAQIHPMYCPKQPRQAAQDYEKLLRKWGSGQPPRFDLALLGIGADGHTASLFPGTQAVKERERLVCELYLPEQDVYRLTLTVPALNQSRLVVFLASGTGKAPMLRRILTDPAIEPLPPARLISPQAGEIQWLVDRAAASLLKTAQVAGE
jgi:6-phosphogluconolactonase